MEFKSIEEIYIYLENEPVDIKSDWDVTNAMKRLADNTTIESEKNKIQWEGFAFDFQLENGGIIPRHSSTKEDGGTIYEYPSYNDFGNQGLTYIKERAGIVNNPHLVARYNQILWNSPSHKHQLQAKNAANAYLLIIQDISNKKARNKEDGNRLNFFKNGFSLAVQAKYKIHEYKSTLQSWLFEKNAYPNDLKTFILNYMLENSQFKNSDFDGCPELIKKIGAIHSKAKTDCFIPKDIYETGLRVAQKLKQNTRIWNKRIGDAIVKMAEYRMDDESRMIPLTFLKEAISYYKLAGLDNKVRNTEQRYFELKKELKLTKYEIPLNEEATEMLFNYLNTKTDKLLEYLPDAIWGFLLMGKEIFPSQEWLIAMEKDRNNTFMDFVVTMKFDINHNVSKQKETKEAIKKAKLYENYTLYLRMAVMPLLHRVLFEGIKKGKLTFNSLIRFISDKTWFGQELINYDAGDDPIKYNWISLIAPSLYEYFIQTESALKSNNPYFNYIMPIDSLTLKFEGALRDFAAILRISTTVTGKGNVLREKYIEELLAENKIQEHFDEDDLLFFNYLFVAKDGMNLRNNIAHCFYRYQNYNFHIMHLLICAFLRLGKYKIRIK